MLPSSSAFPGAGLLNRWLPLPQVLTQIDRLAPWMLKQGLVEGVLNQLFGKAIRDGEFDELDGRTLRLELDGGCGVTLGLWQGRLRLADGPGEATIRGTLEAFRVLAERKQDPDQLFFQRQLVIEGDTELGLAVKNLLDGLEWDLSLAGLLRPLFDRAAA